MVLRFLRFNVVATLGIGVRLLVVWALVSGLGLHYLVGTALAIEASVLHNFYWHLHWTWGAAGNRSGRSGAAPANHVFFRCVAFHVTNGLVSFLGAMVLMPVLVGALGLNYLIANLVAVCFTGVLNFFLGERLVFRASDASA